MEALLERPADELVDALARIEAGRCAVHQSELDLIWAVDGKGLFLADGAASMAAWLSLRFGWSGYQAGVAVRVARALPLLPLIRDAYGQGRICWEAVVALAGFADAGNEAELLEHALHMPVSDLRRLLAGLKPVDPKDAELAYRRRYLNFRWDDRSRMLHLRGELPDEQGVVVAKALELLSDRVRGTEPRDEFASATGGGGPEGVAASPAGCTTLVAKAEDRPTVEQAQADALVELASTFLHAEGDAVRTTVVVHVDSEVFAEQGTGTASLDDGPVVAGQSALRMACDCRSELSVDGEDGLPIGVGRRSRTIPGWLWRALKHRDQTCRFPGCDRTRWTQGHHVHHWTQGGPTDMDNLVLLCWHHHRLVHEGGWTLRGDPNGWLDFVNPAGHALTSLPPPPVEPGLREDLLHLFNGEFWDEPPPGEESGGADKRARTGTEDRPKGHLDGTRAEAGPVYRRSQMHLHSNSALSPSAVHREGAKRDTGRRDRSVPLAALQRRAGNRAVTKLLNPPQTIQRSLGFEFEVQNLRSFQTKGAFTKVATAIAQPAKRKDVPKGAALLKGPNFEMQADELAGGGSDIEFVTSPFDEYDVVQANQTMAAIVAICQHLHNNMTGGQFFTRTDSMGALGSVKKGDSFIEFRNYITGKPQTTIGLRLDQVFALMEDIGLAQGGEAAVDTARRRPGREKLMSQPIAGAMNAPGPAITRVGAATTEVVTALAAYRALPGKGHLAAWVPSNEIKGFLALIFTYMRAASTPLPQYAKAIAPIMARTDFAQMFRMLPLPEQQELQGNAGANIVDILHEFPSLNALNMTQPLFAAVYTGDPTKNQQMLAALTRENWLIGITQGTDQLTKQNFPSASKSVRAEMESMGALGTKTEGVGLANAAAPIFELRGMAGSVPYAQWPALVQLVMQYVRRKNMNDQRALGE